MNFEDFRALLTPGIGYVNQFGNRSHHGTTYNVDGKYGLDEMQVWDLLPKGFSAAWGWCEEPYRMVWLDLKNHRQITYCEGDISITEAADPEAFKAELRACREFYGKPRFMDRDFRLLLGPESSAGVPEELVNGHIDDPTEGLA